MTTDKTQFDIAVIGGGLAGQAAAISLSRAGYSVALIAPDTPPDARTSALMLPSVAVLTGNGLIGDPAEIGHPLSQIRIIDATQRLVRAPETLFDAREGGHRAFGWNFANTALAEAFAVAAAQTPLVRIPAKLTGMQRDENGLFELTRDAGPSVTARLLVGADGKQSRVRDAMQIGVRTHQFAQSALVTDLRLGRSIGEASIEFHYDNGPFTLVPAGGDIANLVWVDRHERLQQAAALPAHELTALLREQAHRLFGTMEVLVKPVIFPLMNLSAETAGRDGVVLVGEAAHAFPPIGAQGLNLGLRDVADLLDVLNKVDLSTAEGASRASQTYAEARAADLRRTALMVDSLFRSLLADILPAQALRAGGLWALKTLPALRKQAFAAGMGA